MKFANNFPNERNFWMHNKGQARGTKTSNVDVNSQKASDDALCYVCNFTQKGGRLESKLGSFATQEIFGFTAKTFIEMLTTRLFCHPSL